MLSAVLRASAVVQLCWHYSCHWVLF